jgi:hypothetical protein
MMDANHFSDSSTDQVAKLTWSTLLIPITYVCPSVSHIDRGTVAFVPKRGVAEQPGGALRPSIVGGVREVVHRCPSELPA